MDKISISRLNQWEVKMGKAFLLWILGVPIVVIILLKVFGII